MNHTKHRRAALLLLTYIACVVLVACATQPFLVAFGIGVLTGGISAYLTIVYWLLKQ